ncbi:MAG: hypothetical protein JW797_14085 [Bradymonadales bacterium]|nr:hypothetical protein [Bradymonadales bacterium]
MSSWRCCSNPERLAALTPPTVFSFACFPAERVVILAGMMAGPALAVITLLGVRRRAVAWNLSLSDLFSLYPNIRLLAGMTVLLALILGLYGAFYLYYRSGIHLQLDPDGLELTRKARFPFGLLGRRVTMSWSSIQEIEARTGRRWLGGRPELVLYGEDRTLVLSIADAWEERPSSRRPWVPPRPASTAGWRDHPLVRTVMALWRQAQMPSEKQAEEVPVQPHSSHDEGGERLVE